MRQWEVYVDGSYNVKTEVYGGAYLASCAELSEGAFQNSFSANKPDWVGSRNVAGELGAVILFLKTNMELSLLKSGDEVIFYYDYTGIQKWADDEWKANKVPSKVYKQYIEMVRSKGISVRFEKVKAHTGVELNETVDNLAKKAVGIL